MQNSPVSIGYMRIIICMFIDCHSSIHQYSMNIKTQTHKTLTFDHSTTSSAKTIIKTKIRTWNNTVNSPSVFKSSGLSVIVLRNRHFTSSSTASLLVLIIPQLSYSVCESQARLKTIITCAQDSKRWLWPRCRLIICSVGHLMNLHFACVEAPPEA